MIRELTVSNYRSLGENVTLKLGEFTALVGANGSGKSNVVDVLRAVSDAIQMGLSGAITHRNGITAIRRWSGGRPFNVSIGLDLLLAGGVGAQYSFELRGDSAEEYRVKLEEALLYRRGIQAHFRIEGGTWVI